MEGKRAASERQHNLAMAAAWYGAVLPLMKKIPPLNDLLILPPAAPQPTQDREHMLFAMRAWAAATRH